MSRSQRTLNVLAVIFALVTAACADSGPDAANRLGPTTSEPSVAGGTLVIRSPGEPGCFDLLAPCAGGATAPIRTLLMPQTVVFRDGRYVPTAVLAAEPIQEPGPPHRLIYKLNSRAIWSDGVPITSSDFRYTWTEMVTAPGIRNRTGFEQIANVDDSDPRTAVITFKQPYAAWYNPFGTLQSIYPKHLLEGKDRNAEMKDGFTWSGGPWKLDRWIRGQEIRLVPNPNYWDKKPNLDALVYRIITDTGAGLSAYKSGQVSLIQNVPPEMSLAELQALPDTTVEVTENLAVNTLTLNTQKAPLDEVAVRQALAYATDRDALVRQVNGLLKPDVKPIQALMTPVNGRWYIEPFARYRRDLAQVDRLMRGAGWARGADGTWTRGSQRAELELVGPAGNKAVELSQQILQSQWKEAGFDVKVNNVSNSGDLARRGAFHVTHGGGSFTNDDPSRCALLCSRNIPTEANGLAGENLSRVADAAHDAAWELVNSEVDDTKRLAALKAAYERTAELVPFLPTAPGLSVLVYNSTRLAGIHTNGGPLGPFIDSSDWFCRAGRC